MTGNFILIIYYSYYCAIQIINNLTALKNIQSHIKMAHQNPYIEYFMLLIDQNEVLRQLADFSTGLLFSQILSKIKQFPAIKLQANPTTFAHMFSNMKQIYKKIEQFWNQYLDKQLECEQIDLVEVAHHKNQKQLAKMLNLIVQTLVLSSQRQFFVGKILQTSTSTQHYFMNIVESTLERRKTFSPRKQRQQRIYDKMIELDHENQNLQNVIVQICKEKQEIESLWKKSQQKISSKQAQIKKLHETLSQYAQTPIKKKMDTENQQKNNQLLQKLKQKMLTMTKQHEKQILGLRQQIQYFSNKSQLTNHLQNQLQMYKIKIQANSEAIQQYTDLSRKYAQMKLNLIQKQEMANQLLRKLNTKSTKLQQVQQKLVQLQLQLQRKNVLIDELKDKDTNKSSYSLDDNFSSFNSISLHKTLSEHCPEVANSQAQFLYESNKKLREELERATSTIRDRENDLQKLRKLYQKREVFQEQNKKLVGIIDQMNEQHEQQKGLILGCMHQLRTKTLNQLAPRERAKKHQMRNNLKAQQIRVFSRATTKKTAV